MSTAVEVQPLTTSDNVSLTLAYMPAPGSSLAVLCTHGVGSSFYTTTLFGVGQLLREQGHTVAVLNNRGHDWLWMNRDRRWLGASHERFEDCVHDIEAAVAWLRGQGHQRIVLAGHSLGCLKVAYAAATRPELAPVGVALCSGPRLPDGQSRATPDMQALLHQAEDLVASGRGQELLFVPMPDNTPALQGVFSAATYVDKYGPNAATAVLPLAPQLTMPALVLAGADEPPLLAFAGELQAALPNAAPLEVIAGADHLYTGCQEAVAETLAGWLRTLA